MNKQEITIIVPQTALTYYVNFKSAIFWPSLKPSSSSLVGVAKKYNPSLDIVSTGSAQWEQSQLEGWRETFGGPDCCQIKIDQLMRPKALLHTRSSSSSVPNCLRRSLWLQGCRLESVMLILKTFGIAARALKNGESDK